MDESGPRGRSLEDQSRVGASSRSDGISDGLLPFLSPRPMKSIGSPESLHVLQRH